MKINTRKRRKFQHAGEFQQNVEGWEPRACSLKTNQSYTVRLSQKSKNKKDCLKIFFFKMKKEEEVKKMVLNREAQY